MIKCFSVYILAITVLITISSPASGAMAIDRVVAYVDNMAITHRELEKEHKKSLSEMPDRTRLETLEAMINTRLMLRDAARIRLSADSDEELLKKYLDAKVRSLILVTDKDIRSFYNNNKALFGRKTFKDASIEIRLYLEESQFNKILKDQISELRSNSRIEILGEF